MLSIFVPLIVLAGSLALFTNISGIHLSFATAMMIHSVSFITLGLTFEIPETSLNLWCITQAGRRATFPITLPKIKRVLRVRYFLTHFIAPCCGIVIIASGLFLAQVAGRSYQTGWLFWIMVIATIGLYKGMYQHNLFVRRILNYAHTISPGDQKAMEMLRHAVRSPLDQVLIFLEFPTYIFNYLVALYKFPLVNPFKSGIARLDTALGLKVYAGILIVLCGSILLPILRVLIRRFSRAQLLVAI